MDWDEATADILETIYDSVDAERGWVPMLDVLDDTFNASVAHLFVRDPDSGTVVEHGFTGPYDLEAKFNRLLPTDP